jgi:linoleate 9S-lipoxygenase
MLGGIIGCLTGLNKNARLKGSVVLMRKRKNVLDLNDFSATVIDGVGEFLGKDVTCQLVSSTLVDGVGEFLGRDVTCQLVSSTLVDPSEHRCLSLPFPALDLA